MVEVENSEQNAIIHQNEYIQSPHADMKDYTTDQDLNDMEEYNNLENYSMNINAYQEDNMEDSADVLNDSTQPLEHDDPLTSQNTRQLKLQLQELEKQYEVFKNQFVSNITQVAENIVQSWDERFFAHINSIKTSMDQSRDYMSTLAERKKEKDNLQQWINKLLNRLNSPSDTFE